MKANDPRDYTSDQILQSYQANNERDWSREDDDLEREELEDIELPEDQNIIDNDH